MTTSDPIILLVDDSSDDALLMRSVFQRAGFVQPLQFAINGDDAIAYLRGDGRYGDRSQFPLPTTVLMDLNMPRKNGFEVLEWIRRQPALRRLRVYILSASSRSQDIGRAYDLGANSYLVKPATLDGLLHLAKCLCAWLQVSHYAPVIEASDISNSFAARDDEIHVAQGSLQLAR
jgi:CheY-like chemotaxis protein